MWPEKVNRDMEHVAVERLEAQAVTKPIVLEPKTMGFSVQNNNFWNAKQ